MESAKKDEKEAENTKKIIMESNPSDDIPVPDNLLVKFLQCECGALLDATDTKCWACNKEIPKKDGKSNPPIAEIKNQPQNHDFTENIPYTNFSVCPKCGSNNEVYGEQTTCWSCNSQFDTKALWEKIKPKNSQQSKYSSPSTHKTDSKKVIEKYVLHCIKCNSWYISNEYHLKMKCHSCGKTKSIYISYTCQKCNKYFDLNTITKHFCPYCKSELILTEERALY